MRILCAAMGWIVMMTPLAAQDRCPTRDDLTGGLRLLATRQGIGHEFVARDGGLDVWPLDTLEGPAAGPGWHQPHAVLPGTRNSAAGRLTMIYAADATALDTLTSGQSWASDVTYLRNGKPFTAGRVEVRSDGLSALPPHRLGACVYEVTTFRIAAHIDGAASLFDMKDYAPELGLVLMETTFDESGTPHGSIVYDSFTFAPPSRLIEK